MWYVTRNAVDPRTDEDAAMAHLVKAGFEDRALARQEMETLIAVEANMWRGMNMSSQREESFLDALNNDPACDSVSDGRVKWCIFAKQS